jgi:hypothetical protein
VLAGLVLEIAAEHILPVMLSELGEYAVRRVSRAALESRSHRRRSKPRRRSSMQVRIDATSVLSDVPGRLRVRVPGLRGDPLRALEEETQLGQVPGVRHVHANALTGSVLVDYDPSINDQLKRYIIGRFGSDRWTKLSKQ